MVRKLVFLLFLSVAIVASATKIQISEPECNPSRDTNVYQLSGGFTVNPTATNEVFYFCNLTGVNWTTLLMVIHTDPQLPLSQIICGTSAFLKCDLTENTPGVIDAFFYDAPRSSEFGGIDDDWGEFEHEFDCPGTDVTGAGVPFGCEFIVDMSCPECSADQQHWPSGTTATGYANVPEPYSAALVVSGLGTWMLRRKRNRG